MKHTVLSLLLALSVSASAANPYLGRWALTIPGGGAGWLGVEEKDGNLSSSVLWGGGSVVPTAGTKLDGDKLIVTREQKNKEGKVTTETITALIHGDLGLKLTTVKHNAEGKQLGQPAEFAGKRIADIPAKPDLSKVKFGEQIQLLNGKDLTGWRLLKEGADNGWSVVDGMLQNRVVKAKDKHFGKKGYGISGVAQAQTDIMTNGPITASFNVYADFLTYTTGVYTHKTGALLGGHAVRVYFAELFAKHGALFDKLGVDVTNGFGDLVSRLGQLTDAQRATIEADIQAIYAKGPGLAMVDSDKGITNLHVPSDVIIDASMPAMIRTSGRMWNAAGQLQDTKCVIPDSSYAGIYTAVFDFCKAHGAFDPRTMGSVPNVGLMAQKAEEYGSHDKTFVVASAGVVRVVDASGHELFRHEVEAGDIWRACQTKDAPVRDWIKLAVGRARATGVPAVFWLDEARAHDAQLITKIRAELATWLADHTG
jgi:hypothetical protein